MFDIIQNKIQLSTEDLAIPPLKTSTTMLKINKMR